MMQVLKQQPTAKSFVERIRHADGSAVHLIKTYDRRDRACWFLLKADERSLARLEHTRYEEMVDLSQYGEVVASGWGHAPDDATMQQFFYPRAQQDKVVPLTANMKAEAES